VVDLGEASGLGYLGAEGPGAIFAAAGGGLANIGKRFEGSYGGLRGFFSKAGKWIESLPQEKFSTEQLLGQLKSAPVKKEELQWLGLEAWLKDHPKVTKTELRDFINSHQIHMEETRLPNEYHVPQSPLPLPDEPDELRLMRESLPAKRVPKPASIAGDFRKYSPQSKTQVVTELPTGYKTVKGSELGGRYKANEYYVMLPHEGSTLPAGVWTRTRGYQQFRTYAGRGTTPVDAEANALWNLNLNAKAEKINEIRKTPDFLEWSQKQHETNQKHYDYQNKSWQYRDKLAGIDRENRLRQSGHPPYYNQPSYKTPGGEDYREVLFKFPQPTPPQIEGLGYNETIAQRRKQQMSGASGYQAGHFSNQGKDLMAHGRVQDFKDTEGNDILLVDEVQSDWHREGRKFGYGGITESSPLPPGYQMTKEGDTYVVRGRYEITRGNTPEDALTRFNQTHRKVIPDAPFKSSWPDLVMKGMLRDAVEKGYDKIAWTTGKTQQDRWNLVHHFPEMNWEYQVPKATGGPPYVKINTGHGNGNITADINMLEDYVGQAAADHIRAQVKEAEAFGKLKNEIFSKNKIASQASEYNPALYDEIRDMEARLKDMPKGATSGMMKDIKKGGEWAENLYDRQIPDFMSKYVKQWGGKVEKSHLNNKLPNPNRVAELEHNPNAQLTHPSEVWSVTITPAMRASIQTEGQPLWGAIPFVSDAINRARAQADKYNKPSTKEENNAQIPRGQTQTKVRQ